MVRRVIYQAGHGETIAGMTVTERPGGIGVREVAERVRVLGRGEEALLSQMAGQGSGWRRKQSICGSGVRLIRHSGPGEREGGVRCVGAYVCVSVCV